MTRSGIEPEPFAFRATVLNYYSELTHIMPLFNTVICDSRAMLKSHSMDAMPIATENLSLCLNDHSC